MPKPIPDDLLELMADKFRMLADPTRLVILRALMQGERNVGEIVTVTKQSQANVSKHLQLLAGAAIVSRRKEGLMVFYKIEDPMIQRICDLACRTIVQDLKRTVRRLSRTEAKLASRPGK